MDSEDEGRGLKRHKRASLPLLGKAGSASNGRPQTGESVRSRSEESIEGVKGNPNAQGGLPTLTSGSMPPNRKDALMIFRL